jgi:hypothetical protein
MANENEEIVEMEIAVMRTPHSSPNTDSSQDDVSLPLLDDTAESNVKKMYSSASISSASYYNPFHGHPPEDLSLAIPCLREIVVEYSGDGYLEMKSKKQKQKQNDKKQLSLSSSSQTNEKKKKNDSPLISSQLSNQKEETQTQTQTRSTIYLAGDSSLDNKHWLYPEFHHTRLNFLSDQDVGLCKGRGRVRE